MAGRINGGFSAFWFCGRNTSWVVWWSVLSLSVSTTATADTVRLSTQPAGSDVDAAYFQTELLPGMLEASAQALPEQQAVTDLDALQLDPNRLALGEGGAPRVYFVGEGAGYRNTLLAEVTTADGNSTSYLVFENASSYDTFTNVRTPPLRTSLVPLAAGDFVDLPETTAGDLDFHIIANGYNGGTNLYSTDSTLNVDGLPTHAVSLVVDALPDSSHLLIGFEDLYGGGDRDYNDLVFAVDIGQANLQQLISAQAPLPGPIFAFMGAMLVPLRRLVRRGLG